LTKTVFHQDFARSGDLQSIIHHCAICHLPSSEAVISKVDNKLDLIFSYWPQVTCQCKMLGKHCFLST